MGVKKGLVTGLGFVTGVGIVLADFRKVQGSIIECCQKMGDNSVIILSILRTFI